MAGRKKSAPPAQAASPGAGARPRQAADAAAPAEPVHQGAPSGAQRIVLGPALNIGAVSALRSELMGMLDGAGDACVDGSAVEAADTAGVQLLLAFQRALQDRGRKIRWIGCSPVLADVCALLGLGAQLGIGEQA